MNRKSATKRDLSGEHFGMLEVIRLSDKRGSRGKRTVPLWECRCECGGITYKPTDKLTNSEMSMCNDCSGKYAATKMRQSSGYVGGTQLSRIVSERVAVTNTSGCRGVYLDKKSGKWRARLKFKGQIMNFGSYSLYEDAVKARKQAEDEYFGTYLQSVSNA